MALSITDYNSIPCGKDWDHIFSKLWLSSLLNYGYAPWRFRAFDCNTAIVLNINWGISFWTHKIIWIFASIFSHSIILVFDKSLAGLCYQSTRTNERTVWMECAKNGVPVWFEKSSAWPGTWKSGFKSPISHESYCGLWQVIISQREFMWIKWDNCMSTVLQTF